MSSRMISALAVAVLLVASSCGKSSGGSSKSAPTPDATKPAETVLTPTASAEGVATYAVDPNATTTQVLKAVSANPLIAAVSVSIPPGTLAIATNITIQEAAPLGLEQTRTELGLPDDVKAAGPAVLITTDVPVDAAVPFTVALSFDGNIGLALAGNYGVAAILRDVLASSTLAQLFAGASIVVTPPTVQIQTTHFGSFQVLLSQLPLGETRTAASAQEAVAKIVAALPGTPEAVPAPGGETDLVAGDDDDDDDDVGGATDVTVGDDDDDDDDDAVATFTLASVAPATDYVPGQSLSLAFSTAVKMESLSAASIELHEMNGVVATAVPLQFPTQVPGSVVTVKPVPLLGLGGTYRLTVKAGLLSTDNVALAEDAALTFTVRSGAWVAAATVNKDADGNLETRSNASSFVLSAQPDGRHSVATAISDIGPVYYETVGSGAYARVGIGGELGGFSSARTLEGNQAFARASSAYVLGQIPGAALAGAFSIARYLGNDQAVVSPISFILQGSDPSSATFHAFGDANLYERKLGVSLDEGTIAYDGPDASSDLAVTSFLPGPDPDGALFFTGIDGPDAFGRVLRRTAGVWAPTAEPAYSGNSNATTYFNAVAMTPEKTIVTAWISLNTDPPARQAFVKTYALDGTMTTSVALPIPDSAGNNVAIAVGPRGHVVVAYAEGAQVRAVRYENGAWTGSYHLHDVAAGSVSVFASVDARGQMFAATCESSGKVQVNRYPGTGAAWQSADVLNEGNSVQMHALHTAPNGVTSVYVTQITEPGTPLYVHRFQ